MRSGLPVRRSNGDGVTRRRPELQLRVARRAQLQQVVVAAIVELEAGDGLRVAAIEALREAQNRRQRADRAPRAAPQVAEAVVPPLRRRLTMVARDEGDRLDFVRLEAAQVAVLDQVIRVFVVALVADVDADVVENRGVLEPVALAIGQAVNGARLIEQRRPPAARPAASAPASSCSARPARRRCAGGRPDSDRPGRFPCGAARCSRGPALRAATGRRASAPARRGASALRRAGSRRPPPGPRGAARGRARAAASRGRATPAPCARRAICFAGMRRLRSGAPGAWPSAAAATAPRLRIVPDVPMTRSNPARAIWFRYLPISASMWRTSLRSSRGSSGSLLTKRSVSRMTPSLKLRPSSMAGAGAARHLDAAAADVDDHRHVARAR